MDRRTLVSRLARFAAVLPIAGIGTGREPVGAEPAASPEGPSPKPYQQVWIAFPDPLRPDPGWGDPFIVEGILDYIRQARWFGFDGATTVSHVPGSGIYRIVTFRTGSEGHEEEVRRNLECHMPQMGANDD